MFILERRFYGLPILKPGILSIFSLLSSVRIFEASNLLFQYHCCGTNNYTEWEDTTYGKNVTGVPDSCCKIIDTGCGHGIFSHNKTEAIFTDGCYTALNDSAMRNIGAIIGGAVALALLQMVGVWMSHCLVRAVKERYEIL
ncbi:CD63 antigen-like [Penaeus indicus]|uniref:CD63 antigen-like n=1 Tax=Penaeus indicus TaxID=29960 RepID=UPI00300D3ECE